MIINIKKFSIARLLFVFCTLITYSWLVIWTTRKISLYADEKSPPKYEKIKISRKFDIIKQKNQTATKDCHKNMPQAIKRWFYARFDKYIQPSWTNQNSELNHDVYAWWLSLQRSEGFNTEKILQQLKDIGVGRYKKKFDFKCSKTCAVIGNSGNLLNSNYGQEIDKHEFVFRLNKAPTEGYENDVGSKTTHRFMYPESATRTVPQDVSMVLIPFKPLDVKWLLSALTTGEVQKTYVPVLSKISCNNSKVIIMNPSFIRYVHNRWEQQNGQYPSTGFLAVIYALHECNNVNLYGFGADKNGNWHHYYEDLTPKQAGAFKSTGVHDSVWERALLDSLEMKGILKLNIRKTLDGQ